MTLTVFFQDEVPCVKSGWRKVELVHKGRKWVKIRLPNKTKCNVLRRRVWDEIERSARDETSH